MTDGEANRRDLIMSSVERYDWEGLRPFVESLRATGYDGEVRFFVNDVAPETIAALQTHGVEVSRMRSARRRIRGRTWAPYNDRTTRVRWHVQPLYRHVIHAATALARDRRHARARVYSFLSNLSVARFFWYWLFLAENADRYRNVMLTDVRDVLFLRTPFDFEIDDRVHCFLEDERTPIGRQTNNTGWLVGAYGPEAARRIGGRTISCAGVTIGSAPAVLEYLTTMIDELARLPWQWNGMEQGVHNYLLHTGRIPHAELVPNLEGAVLTLGIMRPEDALAAFEARAAHAAVVHQYDRHPEVGERLAQLIAR